MYLNLQGLGRLQSASIDLSKALTVFVGRNNTSKTYAAHTIYALHRFGEKHLTSVVDEILGGQKTEYEEPEKPGPWHYEFPIVDKLMPHIPRLVRGLAGNLKSQLANVFATDEAFFAATQVELQVTDIRERLIAQALELPYEDESTTGRALKPAGSDLVRIEIPSSKPWDSDSMRTVISITSVLVAFSMVALLEEVLLPGCSDPLILSTERSAIQLFSRELYGKRSRIIDDVHAGVVDSLARLKNETRFYPLAIRDELRFINGMPRQKHVSSRLAPLATRLEALLGGAVVLDESGDLMYQPEGLNRPLPLHVSASSVKSLAGLAFYLRHIAAPGGLLVIDEPELNLHPDNQRRVARILAQVARAGVRVLISTHSDIIIRELSNLIALHAPEAAELRQKHGYSEEETLDGATVGAYLFDETHARPIDVQATGIAVESIDDEINAMNRVAKDIYFTLQSKTPRS